MTVLFADLSGSSQLAEHIEAESYLELLDHFRAIARAAISRHGGVVARAQGDGVLALFGFPDAHENVGRRATEAALELHSRVAELRAGAGPAQSALQMHSGIHSGRLVISDGDIERGRFDVTGEVANTASRLCSAAAAGEILVSEETLGARQKEAFMVSGPIDMEIRGRGSALSVLRILGHWREWEPYDAATRKGSIPFLGREETLRTLVDAAHAARVNIGPVVVHVIGEAGVGKSRLLAEFQRTISGPDFRILRGYCEGYLGAEPLQPFLQLLGKDGAAAYRGGQAGGGSSPKATKVEQLAAAVADLMDSTPQCTPVVLLDDWQWADSASREALGALLERCKPMLLVVASRPGEQGPLAPSAMRVIELQPLSEEQTARAVSGALESEEPFLAQAIHRQSGGIPLYIEELCHAATRGQLRDSTSEVNVAWISAIVASRVAMLPDEQADLLNIASVLGNAFPAWLLERSAGECDTERLLQGLINGDFLVPDGPGGMLRFKHQLTRDAVYATVTLHRRREIHLRIAQILHAATEPGTASQWLEALSYHYDAAGVCDKAAEFAEQAGDNATRLNALDRARDQYITALRAIRDGVPDFSDLDDETKGRWCRLAQKLGNACVYDPLGVADLLELFELARIFGADLERRTGDVNPLARAEYCLAYIHYSRGHARNAVDLAERALLHAKESGEQKLVAQVQATLAQALASAGQYARALPTFEVAVALKAENREPRPGTKPAIGTAYTLARKAYTLGDLGRFDEAHALFDQSFELLGQKQHSVHGSVMELVCAVNLWQGRWEEASAAGLEGADIAWHCRSRYLLLMGRALAACGSWMLHGDEASLRMLRKSTQWIEERGGAVSTSLLYGWLVHAAAATGDVQQARRHAVGLFQRARARDRQGLANGCRALALLAAADHDDASVRHYLATADAAAAARGSAREQAENELARARIAAVLHRGRECAERAASAADAFDAMGMQWHAHEARGLLQQASTPA